MGPKSKAAAKPRATAKGAAGKKPVGMEVQTQGKATARPLAPRKAASLKMPKRRRQCDCGTAEACFACRRCLEQHCVCGAAGNASVTSLCAESRACNCRVAVDGASRCVLCHGCRHPHSSLSHCRCVQHQEAMHRVATGEKKPTETDKSTCRCFERIAVYPEQHKRRRQRLGMVGRRVGIPSSHGLYANKVAGALGDFDESDIETEGVDAPADAFPVARTNAEELEDLMSVSGALPKEVAAPAAPQHPLNWSTTKPFEESIAHTSDGILPYNKKILPTSEREAIHQHIMHEEMERMFENLSRNKEHVDAKPSEEIVEYLLVASSIKASRMPELIGSLDNTAATAVGIVVDEYIRQLVVRADQQPMCQTTKAAIQDFASMVLRDFDFQLFLQKLYLPTLLQLSPEELHRVGEELVELIFAEFLATQPVTDRGRLMASTQKTPLCDHIRKIVAAELEAARSLVATSREPPAITTTLTPSEDSSVRAVKVTQRTSKVTGQLIYKYDVAATIGDKHAAKVVIDGFESRQGAERSMRGMWKVLDNEAKRMHKMEHPSPPRPVEDPIVHELYQQLLNQVKQARSSVSTETVSKAPATQKSKRASSSSESDDDEDTASDDTPPPHPWNRRTGRHGSPSTSF